MGHSDEKNKDVFAISGPIHMMTTQAGIEIGWDSEEHRRVILACLVNGTYVLERDLAHQERKPLAPEWWESFHFRLLQRLECECRICKLFEANHDQRCFIYGAIFEYVPPAYGAAHRHQSSAPRYVVAFRGTMPRGPEAGQDIYLDGTIMVNQQHSCCRFRKAREEVGELLLKKDAAAGGTRRSDDVWLAGHSLGASIALDVGRDMATSSSNGRCYLPTFLFNPPQVSLAPVINMLLPMEMEEVAKRHLYAASYLVKHALGTKILLRPHKKHMEELFDKLSPWVPNLYVHRRDVISNGFLDYFEQREQARGWSPTVATSAATLSYRDMAYSVFGKQNDRPHLLPSARLWKNQSSHGDAHELRQWWKQQGPDLVLSSKLYRWH
ncbi:unnamed protein product [Urochloa decumbens]|uniref:Uncharacterized protein n=1 Tax=Urochloa decumbens TaxID=240449 RepID=A0ABC9G1Z9_9POAL